MSHEFLALITAAASIGFFHTLFGPDHYVPFIVMSKARQWSYSKTVWVTLLCGLGHVGSAVILGLLGAELGIVLEKLELFESSRGIWAARALIAFGLVYFVYGVRKVFKKKSQITSQPENNVLAKSVPWTLFVIFVLGPCEPLIPFLIYPAVKQSFMTMLVVVGVFSSVTILTMLGIVLTSTFGLTLFSPKRFEQYSHAFAGASILLCGCAILFLGL